MHFWLLFLAQLPLVFALTSFAIKDNRRVLVVNVEFDHNYTFQFDETAVYVLQFADNKTGPVRITTESYDATELHPALIVVQQPKSVISWQIPYIIGSEQSRTHQYSRTARTLCPTYQGNSSESNNTDENQQMIIMMLTCDSPQNITFSVSVNRTESNLELDKKMSRAISPSESEFFSFSFPSDVSSALLHVTSDSNVCMTLSIQNFSCPVYDQEDDLTYKGYWETVSLKGGMMLQKDAFPERLFVVFVVHADDNECTGHSGSIQNRTKIVNFSITRNITYREYLIAMIGVVVVFAMIYLSEMLVACYVWPRLDDFNVIIDETSTSRLCPAEEVDDLPTDNYNSANDHFSEPWSTQNVPSSSRLRQNKKQILCVKDLCKLEYDVLRFKSNLYFWNLLTIAIFYALPVIQLVLNYQKVLNQSGNQDLCYYNFLCSHSFDMPVIGTISDFNHVFSNIGYILLGVLFLLIVLRKESKEELKDTGIPQHYGLYYTLGAALVMEGVLSGCYHFCPSHSNFQFDTSFMYILAVISMLKIYQSRHPDINASAYLAYGVLAFLIFLGMYGVLNGSRTFYYTFTVLHVLTCLYLSAQIYFMGQWKLDRGVPSRVNAGIFLPIMNQEKDWWRPKHLSRMALLVIGNICNWALIGVGLYARLGDFATYLLAILLTNLLLYFTFYILMKIICGEKIMLEPLVYIILSLCCWAAATYFFINKSISWKLTPAQSRTYNHPCVFLDFFDNHDIWHFLSAGSMFFSFKVLLTLDNDLTHVNRQDISVF